MIIVTGANGFIGRYLVEQLVEDKIDVIATGRDKKGKTYYEKKGIPYITLDITNEMDFDKLPKENVDAVVHLAALLSIDAEQWTAKDYFMVNAVGTFNVLEYCRTNNIKKIVFTMTHSDVNKAKDTIITEETPSEFGSTLGGGNALPYIVSKIAALNLINVYAKESGIQGISLRLPGVRGYGSRDTHYNTVFHQFIQKAMEGKPIEIWGEYKTRRDFVYIKDVVGAIIGAIKSNKANGLYNIGSGEGLTIEDEAKAIISAFSTSDNQSKLIYRSDIEEVRKRSYIFDYSKAERDFGYSPKFSYEKAMIDFKKEMERGYFEIEK